MAKQIGNNPEDNSDTEGSVGANKDGAIAQGQDARAVGRDGIMIGGNISGNIYKGLNAEELVDALKRAFPKNDPRPEQFRIVLAEFQIYHQTLFEWKELHNLLDEILRSFPQFSREIQRADSEKTIPSPRTLRTLWRPVSNCVDSLLQYAQGIEYIGEKYQSFGDRSVGETWAVKINELRNRINVQIGLDESSEFDLSAQHTTTLFDKGKILIGLKPEWWLVLYEMNNEFDNLIHTQMHWADKKLRETAGDLYLRSRELFRSQA